MAYHRNKATAEVLALSLAINMPLEKVWALTMEEYYGLMLANKELQPKEKTGPI